jgi:WD40 repeat protein
MLFDMRRLSKILATLLLGAAASAPALYAEEAKPAEKINFQDHVAPILRAKCGNCHSAGEAKGGLVLESFSAVMQGGASGAVVEAGDLDNSRLWALVSHKEQPAMPPKEKLPDDTLAVIRKWIDGGALETKDSKPQVKKKAALTLNATNVTGDKPEGPPPMPEGLSTEPLEVSPRGNAVTALAASPWAPLAAVSGHKQVLLYNLDDQTLAGVLPFPEGTVHVLRFSRNGTLLLAGGGRGGQSGRGVVFDVKSGKRVFEIGNEPDVVLAADISPNHRLIALGGPKKMVRIYSTADGEQLFEMKKHTDWVTAMEFSPDGVLLATGDRSNGLMVWESGTGREFYALNGHNGTISDLSWRVDSNVLASASEDGTVKLWEMNNGTQMKNWNAHGGGALSVAFLRDGQLVSTGRDRVTKTWDQNGAQKVAFPALADLGLKVAYSETNGVALAGDWTGVVKLFDPNTKAERGSLVSNPGTLASRTDEAAKRVAAAQAAVDQQTAKLAALQKSLDDKKAAADAAAKSLADTQAAIPETQKAQAEAEKQLAARTEAIKPAETALAGASVAFERARVEKLLAEKAGDKPAEAAKAQAQQAAEQALAAARKAFETALVDRAAGEKSVADLVARVKALSDSVPQLKAAADKAAAEATPTPEITKAIADTTAALQAATATLNAHKAVAAKLTAERDAATQRAAAK